MQAFGAFVEIAPSKQGLVHISEMSTEPVTDATKHFKVGQEVDVMVLEVGDNR